MKSVYKMFSVCLVAVMFVMATGCASTQTSESTGEYFDDTVITTKVKAAVLKESTLSSSEINVETFKGVVQLSGFVSSQQDIDTAMALAGMIEGVQSVSNSMQVK